MHSIQRHRQVYSLGYHCCSSNHTYTRHTSYRCTMPLETCSETNLHKSLQPREGRNCIGSCVDLLSIIEMSAELDIENLNNSDHEM